ncbi:hypothetical protein ABIA24_004554 [Sinorhizobium fredii]
MPASVDMVRSSIRHDGHERVSFRAPQRASNEFLDSLSEARGRRGRWLFGYARPDYRSWRGIGANYPEVISYLELGMR